MPYTDQSPYSAELLADVCRILELPVPVQGTWELPGMKVAGVAVHLQGWTHPVVFNLDSGEVYYDCSSIGSYNRELTTFLTVCDLLWNKRSRTIVKFIRGLRP